MHAIEQVYHKDEKQLLCNRLKLKYCEPAAHARLENINHRDVVMSTTIVNKLSTNIVFSFS